MPPQPERGEQDDTQPQDLFALPVDERVQAARDLLARAPQQPIEPAAPFEAPKPSGVADVVWEDLTAEERVIETLPRPEDQRQSRAARVRKAKVCIHQWLGATGQSRQSITRL